MDDLVVTTDIARIDAQSLDPAIDGCQSQAVVKMYICHDGHRRRSDDVFQPFGSSHVRDGKADDFRAKAGQTLGIGNGLGRIGRAHCRHGLHRNRGRTTNGNVANLNGQCVSAFDHNYKTSNLE